MTPLVLPAVSGVVLVVPLDVAWWSTLVFTVFIFFVSLWRRRRRP
jgi:hypothetical protein